VGDRSAYVLVVLLGVNGLLAERWMQRVHAAAGTDGPGEVERLARAPAAMTLLAVMVGLTLAIIFVMVAKPTLF
jgi:hypothetical protein